MKTEVISSAIDMAPSPYLHNIFLKWGKTNHSSAFHRVCEQLSVYPGLQMHCYLRVGIPLHPSHPGRGSWERGPEADLEWRGTQTTVCLLHPKWNYDRDKHSFVVHNNMLYCLLCVAVHTLLTLTVKRKYYAKDKWLTHGC